MPSAPPPSGLSRRVGGLLQHGAIAGTVSGVLGAAYHAWLVGHAPDHPVTDTHQTIALAAAFHGRRLAEHFVTPAQRALWWALLLPAAASLVLLVAGPVWMGCARRAVRAAPAGTVPGVVAPARVADRGAAEGDGACPGPCLRVAHCPRRLP